MPKITNLPDAAELVDVVGTEEISPGVERAAKTPFDSLVDTVVAAVLEQLGQMSGASPTSPTGGGEAPTEGTIYYLENHGVINDADSGTGTNNQAAIQAVIDAGGRGDVFVLPAGFTGWSGTVTLQNNQSLVGRGPYGASAAVKLSTMGNTAYFVKTGALNSSVEDIFFYSAPGATGGIAVGRTTVANDGPEQTRIRRCKMTRFNDTGYWYGGINLDGLNNGAAGYGSRDCLVEDTIVHGSQGYQIRLSAVQNCRLIGVDLVRPDFLGGSVSGDLWVTGGTTYHSNDLAVYSSTLDDVVIEVTGTSIIHAGAIGLLFIDGNSASNTIIAGNISGTITNTGTNNNIYNGNVFVGNRNFTGPSTFFTAASPQLFVDAGTNSGSNGIFFRENGAMRWQIRPRHDVSDRFYITDADESHGIFLDQNSGTVNSFCDARVKDNPIPVSVLERMKANPDARYLYSYLHKASKQKEFGPLAQELHRVFPELVVPGIDDGTGKFEDGVTVGDPRMWGVRERAGIYALQGVKELLDRISMLEAEVTRLKK